MSGFAPAAYERDNPKHPDWLDEHTDREEEL